MAIEYIHPSVRSTITDNSTTFITASGTTKLFAAFTSKKGIDNKIQMITTVSEFEFYYGSPDMKVYGQAAYNVINWLNAGGVVYALRVLPEDAGYANAIVNIQSKVTTKQVYDVNHDLVEVDNVELRPTVTYTSINNTSKSAIEFNELRRSTGTTIDGYKNNMIFAVIPKGRGSGYNDLGFRLTLTDAYDSTYDFRLYNFEVTKTSESGSVSTIQGPFLVSLDPDAMNRSGASMFIVDVIANYCDYFEIIFNEDNYNALGQIVNPYVNPNRLDFFNGVSRVIDDNPETYYDDRTMKEEDVHMSLTAYINGEPTETKNIMDGSDQVEASIVLVDNAYRNELYTRYEKAFERVKAALSVVRKIQSNTGNVMNYTNIELENMTENNRHLTLGVGLTRMAASKDLESAYDNFIASKGILENDVTEENYIATNSAMYALSGAIDKLLDQLYEFFDYSRISQNVETRFATICSTLTTNLDLIETNVKILTVQELNCNRYKNRISDIIEEFNELELTGIDSDKEEFFLTTMDAVENIIKVIYNISDSSAENTFADNKLEEVKVLLNVVKNAYLILTDDYVTVADYNEAMTSGWAAIETLIKSDSLVFAINLALLESKSAVYDDIKNSLVAVRTDIVNFANEVVEAISTFPYEFAKSSVTAIEQAMEQQRQYTYYTMLQNYDSYANLLYGTDGEIEGLLWNNKKVERLIIKAYKGTIDDTLTDKDQWPIDMVLDANYGDSIKDAIITLTTQIRDDFMGILDTRLQASPADAINYRKTTIGVNNFRVAIFTQDFIVPDDEYTMSDIQVTPTYFLSSKIPSNDAANGIQWNFVGPRRGTISGFKSISFLPNAEWRERLYKAQVNYVQQDQVSTRFMSQLTSQSVVSALSNISCVRTLLRIQREVEDLMKDFQFEFNDSTTIASAQGALSNYLTQWVTNRACTTIAGSVYASDYDRQQKLLRVKVELSFNSIIERIAIDLVVNQ